MTTPLERDHKKSMKLLSDKGFVKMGETLFDGTRRLLSMCQKQGAQLERNANLMQAIIEGEPGPEMPPPQMEHGEQPGPVFYFVSYNYEHTEHPNGGDIMIGFGSTVIRSPGGVVCLRAFEDMHELIKQKLEREGFNKPKPVIMSMCYLPEYQEQ